MNVVRIVILVKVLSFHFSRAEVRDEATSSPPFSVLKWKEMGGASISLLTGRRVYVVKFDASQCPFKIKRENKKAPKSCLR